MCWSQSYRSEEAGRRGSRQIAEPNVSQAHLTDCDSQAGWVGVRKSESPAFGVRKCSTHIRNGEIFLARHQPAARSPFSTNLCDLSVWLQFFQQQGTEFDFVVVVEADFALLRLQFVDALMQGLLFELCHRIEEFVAPQRFFAGHRL